jgi:uronate dehydrogenase
MNVVCLRIGNCADEPTSVRDLAVWLSPEDTVRLVEAAVAATGWHVVWGVSANRRRWWSAAGGRRGGDRLSAAGRRRGVGRADRRRHAAGDTPPATGELVGGGMPDGPLGGR